MGRQGVSGSLTKVDVSGTLPSRPPPPIVLDFRNDGRRRKPLIYAPSDRSLAGNFELRRRGERGEGGRRAEVGLITIFSKPIFRESRS